MLAWLSYFACGIIWGSSYLGIALGIESFTPWGLVGVRFSSAGLLALGIARLRREPFPRGADLGHLVFQGIVMLGLSNALICWAQRLVPSGITAVLSSTGPFAYALLGRERLTRWSGIGLALGLAGVGLLARSDGAGAGLHPAGLVALPASVLLWVLGTLYGLRYVRSRALVANSGVQMLAGGAFALVLSTVSGGVTHAPPSLRSLLAAAYLAVFASLIAFSAFNYLSHAWPLARMSTYSYLNPVVAVILGCAFLGETIGVAAGAGMAAIVLGVVLVQTARMARRADREREDAPPVLAEPTG